MNINNQEIDLGDLISQKYMHKKIKNNMYLSDYQIEVLNNYGIKPEECSSITELIYLIDEVLEDEDADDLELVSKEISEFNYYCNVNK